MDTYLINWVAPAVVIVTSALVPIFVVVWSIILLSNGERRVLTSIKAIVSLVVWVPFSYVMIYVYLAVSLHGGAVTSVGRVERTLLGNIVLIGSSLVYAAIGYGLVVWVRGKSATGWAASLESSDRVQAEASIDRNEGRQDRR
jgi:hypothetical protein